MSRPKGIWLVVVSIFLVFASQSVNCAEDVVLQIFSKRFINVVSDKFISFSIDPKDLLKICHTSSENFTRSIAELGTSYLKITGESTKQLSLIDGKDSNLRTKLDISTNDWKNMYNSIRSIGLKPIIALPYDPQNWNTRDVMRILATSNNLGFEDCIWQLGSDFNSTDAINYVDDLSTLRTIVDTFTSRNKKNDWGVVGSDLSSGSDEEEARLFSELSQHIVEAIGWSQSPDHTDADSVEDIFSTSNVEPALRTIMNGKLPVWLSLTKPSAMLVKSAENCSPPCLSQGLNWAKTLGDASRNGFKIIYKPINPTDLSRPSMSYYITRLHKQLVGEKVFDTKAVSGSRMFSHFYSHCTKNISGAFTVMGINTADTRLKVTAKLSNKYTGSEVRQYILTVNSQNGKIQLNGDDIVEGTVLAPLVKVKRPNKAMSFALPPFSVGFWVVPNANLRECIKFEGDLYEYEQPEVSRTHKSIPKTSKEVLLQELIFEAMNREEKKAPQKRFERHTIIKKDSSSLKRERRDISSSIPKIDEELNKEQQRIESFKDKLDAENVDNNVLKRGRRFILNSKRPRRSDMLLETIYKEVDDVKRRNIFSPLRKLKNGLFGKHSRSKRQVANGLGRLFEKFDLKKPRKISFKQPKINKDSFFIRPISTIHDVHTPSSAEMKIFQSSENRDLPHGDVYFNVGSEVQSPDYVALDENERPQPPIQHPRVKEPIREVPDDASMQRIPNQFVEYMYSDLGRQGPQVVQIAPKTVNIPQFGELWEADVFQRPHGPQESHQHQQQVEQVPPQQMDFVVQELQPTWQKNRENLMKARNNLQQYYVASSGQPIPINSFLPIAGGYEHDTDDDGFFESKRRKRSIDDKMNDEIEDKLQHVHDGDQQGDDAYLSQAADKITLLEKMLEIVDHINRDQTADSPSNLDKLSEEIKELEAFIFRRTPMSVFRKYAINKNSKLPSIDSRKRCKIMATSYEEKCLREDELFDKSIFKREAKYTDEDKSKKPLGEEFLKKWFPKSKRALSKLREKRNAILKTTVFDADFLDENENEIRKDSIEVESRIPIIKTIFVRAENDNSPKSKTMESRWKPEVPRVMALTETQSTNDHENREGKVSKVVNGVVNKVVNIVNKYVAGCWKMFS